MSGGVSHVDTFDPKPRLTADHGKLVSADRVRQNAGSSWRRFGLRAAVLGVSEAGKCGTEVSNLFPHIAQCMDDICVIRSMTSDHVDHTQATLGLHTGSFSVARPSMGSWVSYGLGTVNQNLPSFVVLAPELPYSGTQVWGSDFLPGSHQGTASCRAGTHSQPRSPRRLRPHARVGTGIAGPDQPAAATATSDGPASAARLRSFETAFGMQMAMPEVLDLSQETEATLRLYGLERGSTWGSPGSVSLPDVWPSAASATLS